MGLPVSVGDMVIVNFSLAGTEPDDPRNTLTPRLLLSAQVIDPRINRVGMPTSKEAVRWILEFYHPDKQTKTKMSVYERPDGSTYPEIRVYNPEDKKETT